MSVPLRKLVLTVHITSSVGWIGAVVAYLVLVIVAINQQQDTQTLMAAWLAMKFIGYFAIVPLSMAALTTGLVISLGTKWGLFQHYWVLLSFVLTLFATIILLQHMPTVRFFADLAAVANVGDLNGLQVGLQGELFHAGIGLLVLVVIQTLNIYKPRGLTPYGWRKQQEERKVTQL
jgi:uncharacterized membrane protein